MKKKLPPKSVRSRRKKSTSSNEGKHKFWLILIITFAILAILVLAFYNPLRQAVFGKSIAVGEPLLQDSQQYKGALQLNNESRAVAKTTRMPQITKQKLTPKIETICDDGLDNDLDDKADCADTDCAESAACKSKIIRGDVDCNGVIDIVDAIRIQQFYLGIITQFKKADGTVCN